jgi:GxxExxY protein
MSLIYEDQTKVLRRCFFDVHNEVGLGRHEEGYHQACRIWLEENQIPVRSKPPHELLLRGEVAHKLFPDLVAWDAITIELKAVPRKMASSEFVQLFDYLKCRGDRLGLLVNMGLDRVHVERIVYELPKYELKEDWQHWARDITGHAREVGAELRVSLRSIYDGHATGYGEETIRKLVMYSLKQHRLSHVLAPLSKTFFRGRVVDECPLDCLVVEGCILMVFTALFDSNQFNISRGMSYMKALDLEWGIAVNFGRQIAEVTGLRIKPAHG